MIALYLDHDSSDTDLVVGLRRAGIDILTTRDAGNATRDDAWQLEYAFSQGRTIYSANVGDFGRLHKSWMAAGSHHAGIIVRYNQRMPVSQQLARLLAASSWFTPETMADFFVYLDSFPLG